MAKQVGPLFVTGTIDGIIFYKLNGKYYMRSKGDYKSGKMMRKDPRLKRTMENADRFGVATKLVKPLYHRHLPKEVRKIGLFGKLTGMVNQWLYQGKTKEEAKVLLIAYLQTLVPMKAVTPTAPSVVSNTKKEVPVTATPQQRNDRKLKAGTVKQARYLSRWKVKPSGRLQIPISITTERAPLDSPLAAFNT